MHHTSLLLWYLSPAPIPLNFAFRQHALLKGKAHRSRAQGGAQRRSATPFHLAPNPQFYRSPAGVSPFIYSSAHLVCEYVEIKQQPNKSGGGEGQWAAWKASKLAKEYEKQGGGYENEPGSKNEPKKGDPEPKSERKKEAETQD